MSETLKKEITMALGSESLAMLLYYEAAYPPDLALEVRDDLAGFMDFIVEGGTFP